MSSMMNEARSRVPRIAGAAVERARLTVVPRVATSRAPRVPFMTLVSVLLVAGVAGLLFFNTSMQQVSFKATAMEHRAQLLTAEQQGLQMDLDRLRNPQRVAAQAKRMGMVPVATPAFLRLRDGAVLGDPTPASWADSIKINPLPVQKPKNLRPRPVVVPALPGPVAGAAPAAGTNGVIGGAAPQATR